MLELYGLMIVAIAAKSTILALENELLAQIMSFVEEREVELSKGPLHCGVAQKLVLESFGLINDSDSEVEEIAGKLYVLLGRSKWKEPWYYV